MRPYSLRWCEIKILLKSQNPQADYGFMSIPEQLYQKLLVIGYTIFCKIGLKELAHPITKNI